MVIDYLPPLRIPRIPYSDRPHGPKIEPSITGAPLSFSSLFRLLRLFLLLLFHFLSFSTLPNRSVLSPISSRRATKDIIPCLGNTVLIKHMLFWHLLIRTSPYVRHDLLYTATMYTAKWYTCLEIVNRKQIKAKIYNIINYHRMRQLMSLLIIL